MQKMYLACCLLLGSMAVFGQKQQRLSEESYVLSRQPAVKIVLPHSPKVVMEAIENYKVQPDLSSIKRPSSYVAFLNTPLMQKNIKEADLVFRVGADDPGDNSTSAVYLMLDNKIEKGKYVGDIVHFKLEDALAFMDNLAVVVNQFAMSNLDNEIKLQTYFLTKGQRLEVKCTNRCTKLDSRKQELHQKMVLNKKGAIKKDKNLEQRIINSQSALAYQKAAVEKQKLYVNRLTSQQGVRVY